jgi:hydroxyacylglutathione hydrolase
MIIKQFKDEPLSHYSYAIISDGNMVLIDPSRNPTPYYKLAESENATIKAVFETHPHADFVSSHLQISRETGAVIYTSSLVGADYEHRAFDEGDSYQFGKVVLKALHTPGHSPDSITIVAEEEGKTLLFTGDTLFIGDVGRPDLRENVGNKTAKRIELAKSMYHTIQTKFKDLPDDAVIYPAHGAGSLCGKNMSSESSSTLRMERLGNWAFKVQTEEEFVEEILQGQPFIPSYFGFNVDLNKTGPEKAQKDHFSFQLAVEKLSENAVVVDTRDSVYFKKGHLENSINIMARGNDDKYETWLGSIVKPHEPFYIVVATVEDVEEIFDRTAKIGYEKQLKGIVTLSKRVSNGMEKLDLADFKNHPSAYTIVDVRNDAEVAEGKIFEEAIAIPLNQLRDRASEIPADKPLVVHCAGGYRSAAGSSILENKNQKVYDLGNAVNEFN